MILINGEPGMAVRAQDRGLLLGDGLFETLRVQAGRPQLWRYHWQRLTQGLNRLGFPELAEGQLLEEIARVGGNADCMVRLTVTRGEGPRGYAPPENPTVTRIVSGGPALEMPNPKSIRSLTLGWADVPIGINPALAGLKHTSRLEHVLARRSWRSGWDEAILCDALGRVVSVTQGNLWLRRGEKLITPPVRESGIAGTRRAWVLDHAAAFGFEGVEAYPDPAEVRGADALYVSNARIGMTPANLAEADKAVPAWQDDPLYPMGIALHEAD
ncbi:aminodeoxychorismate lyase [Thioalkalivibrio sp. ALJ1]|uniref:aminodeoxychorismate lyase n=1 Tax=Thioalkalivibrio sp. ALJ1 TaxID=1158144 RepID=UPI00056EC44B|nr:aminodeoxychorismate lyase [Thioalkalivibrio sp. ALJ1]